MSSPEGVEVKKLDGVPVRIYDPEKTIAHCFKFRNKLGMEVVLEALCFWREKRGRKTEALLEHARHCRVERILRPATAPPSSLPADPHESLDRGIRATTTGIHDPQV